MRKLLRLLALTFSMSLRRSLAHRVNLAFDVGQTLVFIGAILATTLAIYHQTDLLAGWTRAETLVLTGIFALVSGLRGAFIDPSLTRFVGAIRDGTLDEALLRPAPSWFTTTCREHAPLALGQSILGLGVTGFGLAELPKPPGPLDLLIALGLTVCAVVITWALSLIIASLGFWAGRFEMAPLTSSLWELGRYPTAVYDQPLRTVVGYLLPVAGMITLPSAALTRGDSPTLLLTGLALTFAFIALALLTFRFGLRRYTGATS